MWQSNGFQRIHLASRGIGSMTKALLIITVGVFVLVWSTPGGAFERVFGLSRIGLAEGKLWQVVSYMFLHGSFMHLLGNMLGLYFFGTELEQRLGSRRFLLLYLGCGLLGGLGWLMLSGRGGGVCIGASGAVLGMVGTFAALYPRRQLTLLVFYVLPVTLTARTLALVIGGISLLFLGSDAGGIAHAAHLAGGIAGYVYGLHLSDHGLGGVNWRLDRMLSDWMARRRRTRFRVVSKSTVDEPVDWQAVDRILVKVRATGMQSLTAAERDLLDRASRKG